MLKQNLQIWSILFHTQVIAISDFWRLGWDNLRNQGKDFTHSGKEELS